MLPPTDCPPRGWLRSLGCSVVAHFRSNLWRIFLSPCALHRVDELWCATVRVKKSSASLLDRPSVVTSKAL
eukprot:maker-scaffold594_size129171-snap-gene-0.21 protein:Tk01962 transcript:maker-scaffold594_size129171-snap-gene-0.21-mRNA-1 annotation:"isoleucyl-trna synthetase"